MTESLPAADVVAIVRSCEQYRFRVELPSTLDRKVRVDIRRRALHDTNAVFLECTRRYQAVAWVGFANLSFTDSRSSPSDSKSEFLHSLISLKLIELSILHLRSTRPEGDTPVWVLVIEAPLSWAARKSFGKLCADLGVQIRYSAEAVGKPIGKPRIGGAYRAARQGGNTFAHQPIKRIEDFQSAILRRLSGRPLLRKCVSSVLGAFTLLLWPIPITARFGFSLCYRAAANRLLKRLDSPKNTFVYFDLRLGRNRDVGAYLRWKYGAAFPVADGPGSSTIAFSHLARPGHAYSMAAMWWAFQSLRRMKHQPLEGCVVVNYLIPPWLLLKLHFRRNAQRKRKRRRLRELHKESTDYLARIIYTEFISSLEHTNAFAMEVSRCYQSFFDSLAPGVVLQADAAAKTARHFTACARRRGGRVIYVADRICTALRTSNQLIADDGDNPHFPDRCVVFDQVSKAEFMRQGLPADHIYSYHRNFASERGASPAGARVKHAQVVILLQAYEDNIGAMVRVGADIASRLPKVRVLYQEHPNFPVCDRMKTKLLEAAPGRLRFLAPREPVDYTSTLALITGYSTAAVPGILHGVPLIWLRRQIDNSIYGEDYLDRIGFAADKSDEVVSFLKRLLRRDIEMLQACATATVEAKVIFLPSSDEAGIDLKEALAAAVNDSFAEIAASTPLFAEAARPPLAPVSA